MASIRGVARGGIGKIKQAKDYKHNFAGPRCANVTCLLLFTLAVVAISLSSVRIMLGYPLYAWRRNQLSELHNVVTVELNETLLRYSEEDPWTPEELHKLKLLLDDDLVESVRRRIRRWQKDMLETSRRNSSRSFNPKNRKPKVSLPLELVHPRYFKYWAQSSHALLSWLRRKKYEPHVMNELLTLIKEPIDRHFNSGETEVRPYKQCAVVGNSGILLNKSYGSFIDSHDMVVRLNNARIKGFEQHVGSKTTFSFINSNILTLCSPRPGCFCHPYGADVPIVAYMCQALHFVHLKLCCSSTRTPLLATDPRFDILCMRIVKYYSLKHFFETRGGSIEEWKRLHGGSFFHYSSGMQAIMLALGICEKVDIFGFGKSATAKHHYHTNQKGELSLHDYEAEYILYNDLANKRPIPFLSEAGFRLPLAQLFA